MDKSIQIDTFNRIAQVSRETITSLEKYEEYIWGGNLSQLTIIGIDFWFPLILILSALICVIVAIPLALITIRLKEDYLALVTLGLAETLRIIFVNESWLANGTRGL